MNERTETIQIGEDTLIRLARLNCNSKAKTFEQCITNMLNEFGVKKK